jgi:hypothetical protein
MKMKSNISILLVMLASVALAAEQPVSVKFRVAAPGLAPLSATCSGAKPSSVEIPEGSFSEVHSYRGPAASEFVSADRAFPVTFPAATRTLLVLLRAEENAEPSSLVIEEDAASQAQGSITFINVGKRALRVKVGEEAAPVEAGAKATFAFSGRPTAFVQVTEPENETILLSNNWSLSPKGRTVVVLDLQSETPTRFVFHRLNDLNPASK